MIINPAAHAMIPGRNVYRRRTTVRRKVRLAIPGGSLLWLGVAKALVSVLFVCAVATSFLNSSAARLGDEIGAMEAANADLVASSHQLRSQREKLFSLATIESMAGEKLAIYQANPGQHRTFRKSSGMFY